jgi:hypothetical protein
VRKREIRRGYNLQLGSFVAESWYIATISMRGAALSERGRGGVCKVEGKEGCFPSDNVKHYWWTTNRTENQPIDDNPCLSDGDAEHSSELCTPSR